MPDPTQLIDRTRKLCEAATLGKLSADGHEGGATIGLPDGTMFMENGECSLANAELVVFAVNSLPELADALERSYATAGPEMLRLQADTIDRIERERDEARTEVVETRERKLFSRRQLEELKAQACDAIGMPITTDTPTVGGRIAMLIRALRRERDKALAECERLRRMTQQGGPTRTSQNRK